MIPMEHDVAFNHDKNKTDTMMHVSLKLTISRNRESEHRPGQVAQL